MAMYTQQHLLLSRSSWEVSSPIYRFVIEVDHDDGLTSKAVEGLVGSAILFSSHVSGI